LGIGLLAQSGDFTSFHLLLYYISYIAPFVYI